MKRLRRKLTYANVVSSLCLFLLLGGGAAFAASKIRSGQIAHGAVTTNALHQRAVSSGKLAVGAVRSNQIANRAVGRDQIAGGAIGSDQIANGAVGSEKIASDSISSNQLKPGSVQPSSIAGSSLTSAQIKPGSIEPSSLAVPLSFSAEPSGGALPLTSGSPVDYPLDGATWTQSPGEIDVVFGETKATMAYDGSGAGSCEAFMELRLNGVQVGGGNFSTSSETLTEVSGALGANPQIDPPSPKTNTLTARVGTNGACTSDSAITSSRFRILSFG